MVRYDNRSIEEIITDNLSKIKSKAEPIISVGVDVIVYLPNQDKPFFYKGLIKHLRKSDLDEYVPDGISKEKIMERYLVAVRANINILIDKMYEQINNSRIIAVLGEDWYTKKLIGSDLVKEVQGFIYDPQAEWVADKIR